MTNCFECLRVSSFILFEQSLKHFSKLAIIMIDIYQTFIHDEFSEFGFSTINYAETKQFLFLNYDAIMQEQINNLNDFESFATVNLSTSLDSSNDEIDELSFSNIKQLVKKMKTCKAM